MQRPQTLHGAKAMHNFILASHLPVLSGSQIKKSHIGHALGGMDPVYQKTDGIARRKMEWFTTNAGMAQRLS